MIAENRSAKSISHKSFEILMGDFRSFGISPSPKGMNAFKSLFDTLESALTGQLGPSYYLSSLDPGSGKTQAISCFLKAWKSNGFLPEGSVLVGVKTKEEIRGLVNRLGLDDADFACLTRDDEINALGLGKERRHEARLLITTQQMILSRTRDRSFSAASDFHYNGKARSLRIWDESLVLAQPITLSWTALGALAHELKGRHRDLSDRIQAFVKSLGDEANRLITIPREFKELAAEALREWRRLGKMNTEVLESLRAVAGRPMWLVAESGSSSQALIGASKPLPADFAPAIITDASGRVRGTYKIWERAGGLIRLPANAHDYRDLRINLWARSVGKDVLRDHDESRRIYGEIAKVMNARKNERWLVISYKPSGDLDVEKDLRETVDEDTPFEYLWWGRHHGTNEFKDFKNIVVIGSNFYADLDYKSLTLAASGKPVDEADLEALPNLKGSEFQHNVLQAVMRGHARNSRNGVAGECNVYIVASKAPGPAELIEKTFPGCKLEKWGPTDDGLSGHGKTLVSFLTSYFADTSKQSVKKKDVRERLGIATAQHFGTLLKQIPVKMAIDKIGLVIGNKSIHRK